MSLYTDADTHLESAKRHLQSAIEDLDQIVVKKCWGACDFNPEMTARIQGVFIQLLRMQLRLSQGQNVAQGALTDE